MTAKNKAFAEAYIACGYNASKAYLQVYGCTKQCADTNSQKLMKNPEIRDYIGELIQQVYQNQFISAEKIAAEIASIAFSDDEALRKADKLKALELLQKQLGLQSQRVELSNDIIINIVGKEDEQ